MSINIIIILDNYSTQHDMTLDCVVLVSLLSCLLKFYRLDGLLSCMHLLMVTHRQ